MKKLILNTVIIKILLCLSSNIFAQPTNTDWQQKYGDSGSEVINWLIEASSGNVVAVGRSSDKGGNGFLIIADAATGRPIKTQSYGGNFEDELFSAVQTWDGGFLLVGKTQSQRVGSSDGWLIKINERGETIWEKKYSTSRDDVFKSVVLLADGTAMVAGTPNGAKKEDLWLLLVDTKTGAKLAEKTLQVGFKSVEQMIITSDGGYAVLGNTEKGNGRLVKVDAQSNLQWNKEFGEKNKFETVENMVETDDGGFAVIGSTWAALEKNQDGQNLWLYKLNKYGNYAWQKTFGGRDDDFGHSITEARDGGLVLVGKTKSQSVGARKFDMMVIKVTPDGGLAWQKNYGGGDDEQGLASTMSYSGGLIMGGQTDSQSKGANDAWLIKLSDSFSAPVSEVEIAYSDIKFVDDNGRLDADEMAYFELKLTNKGDQAVYDLNVVVKPISKAVGIHYWEIVHGGDWQPNQTRKLRLPIRGGRDLQDGAAEFDFTFFVGKQRDRNLATRLECKGAKPAEVFVADTKFQVGGAAAKKDAPEAIIMNLVNIGGKPFNDLSVQFTLPKEFQLRQGVGQVVKVGKLEAGVTLPVEFGFTIPKEYPHKNFVINYKIFENNNSSRKKNTRTELSNINLKAEVLEAKQVVAAIPEGSQNMGTPIKISENVTIIWVTPDPSEVDVTNMASEVEHIDVKLKTISNIPLDASMFKVFINGIALEGAKFDEDELRPPTKTKTTSGSTITVSTYKNRLPLKKGDNRILVEVDNKNLKSVSEEIMVNLTPQLPNLHVLAIGVAHEDLKYTTKDAEDFAAAFANQQGKLFNKVFVSKRVTKSETTDSAIKEAFIDLNQRFSDELSANRIHKRDVLVVFISSHGKTSRNRFKILPSNYDKKYGDFDLYVLDFKTDVMDYLDPINCKKLLLIDACHSGAAYAVTGSKAADEKDRSDALARLVSASPGLTTLTSSDRSQLSYEDDRWQNGAFTEAILEAFEGKNDENTKKADENNDKILTISELYQFLQNRVPKLVRQFKPNAPTDQTPFKPENELDDTIPIYELK